MSEAMKHRGPGRPRLYAKPAEKDRARRARQRAQGYTRLKFWLDADRHARLRAAAAELGLSISQFVAAALNRTLKNAEN